jgi:hypothetical protein
MSVRDFFQVYAALQQTTFAVQSSSVQQQLQIVDRSGVQGAREATRTGMIKCSDCHSFYVSIGRLVVGLAIDDTAAVTYNQQQASQGSLPAVLDWQAAATSQLFAAMCSVAGVCNCSAVSGSRQTGRGQWHVLSLQRRSSSNSSYPYQTTVPCQTTNSSSRHGRGRASRLSWQCRTCRRCTPWLHSKKGSRGHNCTSSSSSRWGSTSRHCSTSSGQRGSSQALRGPISASAAVCQGKLAR